MACVGGTWKETEGGYGVPTVTSLPGSCAGNHDPRVVFVGGERSGVYGCDAMSKWSPVTRSIIYAHNYDTLGGAVEAAGSNAEIVLAGGHAFTLKSQLRLRGANVTLRCEKNSIVVKEFNGDAIRVEGSNIAIDGCTIDGARLQFGGGTIVIANSTGVLVRDSSILNGAGTGIGIFASTNVKVVGNALRGNLGDAIFAQDFLDRIEIALNTADSSAVAPNQGYLNTIGVHTYGAGGTATRISIHGNTILHGGDDFGIEVGAFGPQSARPSGVSISANKIRLSRECNGGISLSTLNGATVENNRVDAAGHIMHIDAIELAFSNAVKATGNSIVNVTSRPEYTLTVNGGSDNTIADNVLQGGIYIGTSSTSTPQVDSNVLRGNDITATSGAAYPRGLIWLQCNTSNCSVSRNSIFGNFLRGNGSGPGITFENDYAGRGGVMASNVVGSNRIAGSTMAVNTNGVPIIRQ